MALFIVCGFSLTLGAILLRVAFSAVFQQPTQPPTADPHELGALAGKIGNPGDAAGTDTVFGKIAGVGGGGDIISVESFEGSSFDHSNFFWSQTGGDSWSVSNGTFGHSGHGVASIIGMTSGSLGTAVYMIGDGSISFWLKTRAGYQDFYFNIDLVRQAEIENNWTWTLYSYPLTAGWHTIDFEYAVGTASGWAGIDDIVLINGLPGK